MLFNVWNQAFHTFLKSKCTCGTTLFIYYQVNIIAHCSLRVRKVLSPYQQFVYRCLVFKISFLDDEEVCHLRLLIDLCAAIVPKLRVRLVDDQGSTLRFVFLQIKVLTEHCLCSRNETCIH